MNLSHISRHSLLFAVGIFLLSCDAGSSEKTEIKPASAFELADPTIFFQDGTYYLYGTGDPNGFKVYTSSDLEEWDGPAGNQDGYALKKGDSFGDKGFWAPQVFTRNDSVFMAYAANENIAIAGSKSPLGPFKQKTLKQLDAPVKQIDPFVFKDDDGKYYLYHVRLQEGNRIFVAEMTDDMRGIKNETLTECISSSEGWENTQSVPWPVAEGPTVIKHNNVYYLLYSSNDFRNPDYAVGFATSDNPIGPWHKYAGNPILSRKDLGINGTGHGDIITDNTGQLKYVFHTHQSNSIVSPRKTAIINVGFKMDNDGKEIIYMDKNSFTYLIGE